MSRNEKSKARGDRSSKIDAVPQAGAETSVGAKAGNDDGRQRIAKVMARAGLCSRREAERWILEGRVSVNGTVLRAAACDIGPEDVVLVDGVALPAADATRLFLFHKPRGLVTSDRDPEGRATVADFIREKWPDGPRVVTIGRLDINTEGLLLLTNDGGLARVLELPETGWLRRYRVRARGQTDQAQLDALARGIEIDGIAYAGIEATLDRIQGSNCWLTMGLREGKNREIKRVLEHLGLEVNRLIRLSFGPFQLQDLPEGEIEEVKTRILRDQLGEALTAASGAIFVRSEPDIGSEPARTQQPIERGSRTPRPSAGKRTAHGAKREASDTERTPRERPERSMSSPRRHITTLRNKEEDAGPRRRIERDETKDRRDRSVAVERIVRAGSSRRSGRKQLSPSAEAKQLRIARTGPDSGTRGPGDGARTRSGRSPKAGAAQGWRDQGSLDRKQGRSERGNAPSRAARETEPSSRFGKERTHQRSGTSFEPNGREQSRPFTPNRGRPRDNGGDQERRRDRAGEATGRDDRAPFRKERASTSAASRGAEPTRRFGKERTHQQSSTPFESKGRGQARPTPSDRGRPRDNGSSQERRRDRAGEATARDDRAPFRRGRAAPSSPTRSEPPGRGKGPRKAGDAARGSRPKSPGNGDKSGSRTGPRGPRKPKG